MPEFAYQEPFPLGPDSTPYRRLTSEYVSVVQFNGGEVLKASPYCSRRPRPCSIRQASRDFLDQKLRSLGTAACPPYHLAVVIGGTSAEATMKTVKLASTGYLDALPTRGNQLGQAFRDLVLEDKIMELARKRDRGPVRWQVLPLDARVIRLPRHGASCPVGIGVSCSADRDLKARIDRHGLWIEELECDPARFIPGRYRAGLGTEHAVSINLDRPISRSRSWTSRRSSWLTIKGTTSSPSSL